jgi:hypothetical protein
VEIKWDMLSYSAVKQCPCVEEVHVSSCDKMYRNCDSIDHNEYGVISKLSEVNHVQRVQVT